MAYNLKLEPTAWLRVMLRAGIMPGRQALSACKVRVPVSFFCFHCGTPEQHEHQHRKDGKVEEMVRLATHWSRQMIESPCQLPLGVELQAAVMLPSAGCTWQT